MTTEQLQRQIFKDHLAKCQQRLADARASVASKSGVELGNAILLMHERQHEFRRALDLMWEAQGGRNEEPSTFDPVEYADRMIEKHHRPLIEPTLDYLDGLIDPDVLRIVRGTA